jgi:integrase
MENNIEEKKENIKKEHLSLTQVSEGIRVGVKSNGVKYTVRTDRSAYFFPERWVKFFETINAEKQDIFDVLINTGARIEEALNIKPEDFDWERNNLTLKVTKTKAKKGESVGRKRTFSISSQFARRMRKYINEHNIQTGQVLFSITKQAVSQMMKRGLLKAEFEDWQQFSLHNIRKTHGNWLKALDIPSDEICLRLGHDHNTYLRHYGSASIFDRKDKMLMIKILGDVYGLK